MKERVGIFINSAARKEQVGRVLNLAKNLQNPHVEELKRSGMSIPKDVGAVIVVGGDGSVNAVSELMLERHDPGVVLVMPAGSQNGLYNSLLDAKTIIDKDQVLAQEFSDIKDFRPGNIGNKTFNHVVGLGNHEIRHGATSSLLRDWVIIPRGGRDVFVPFLNALEYYKSGKKGEFNMKIILTSQFIGSFKMIREQNLYEDTLTLVSQAKDAKNPIVRAALFFMLRKLNLPVSEGLVEMETKKEFEFDSSYKNQINLDGELIPFKSSGTIFVRRHEKAIKAAALKL